MKFFLLFFLIFISSCSTLKNVKGVRPPEDYFKMAWQVNYNPSYQSGNVPVGYGVPLVHELILFAGTPDGRLIAHQLNSGKILWQQKSKGPIVDAGAVWKKYLIYGDQAGYVYSRNLHTGDLSYATDLGAPVEVAPVIYQDRAFFQMRDHRMVCLDASSGKILWQYHRSVAFPTTLQKVSKPLGVGNLIIAGFADGSAVAISLEEGGLVWEQKIAQATKFVDVDSTPLLWEGRLYMASADGHLVALEPTTGQLLHAWDVEIYRSPIAMKKELILSTLNGEILSLGMDGKMLKKAWVSSYPLTAATLWKDHLVMADAGGSLWMLNPNSGKVVQKFSFGNKKSAVYGDLSVLKNYLAFYSSRNRLYVFRQ